jgi:hypothetical protein
LADDKTTGIPEHLLDGLRQYIDSGIPLGSFLEAVVSNDLRTALLTADPQSLTSLTAIVLFMARHAPAPCWGSAHAYRRWVRGGGLRGMAT